MLLPVTEARRPWRRRHSSKTPEPAAKVVSPDLGEWVLNLDMSGTISVKNLSQETEKCQNDQK